MNGVPVPAVIKCAELREKILRFRVLRLIFEIVVIDRLGPPEVVDAAFDSYGLNL